MKKVCVLFVGLWMCDSMLAFAVSDHVVEGDEVGDIKVTETTTETWSHSIPWMDADDTPNGWNTPKADGLRSVAIGYGAKASNSYSFVAGGRDNVIEGGGDYSSVVGGQGNVIYSGAFWSSISGGEDNEIDNSDWSAINGGGDNTITGMSYNVVGGGRANLIRASSTSYGYNTIAGGYLNTVTSSASSVSYSSIGGGYLNRITAGKGTIAGGQQNVVLGTGGSIMGGAVNTSRGTYSSILGGSNNLTSNDYNVAAGRYAQALHDGCFVFADANTTAFKSTGNNQARFHVVGGFYIQTSSAGAGVQVGSGSTSWATLCDRELKVNNQQVEPDRALDALLNLKVETYNARTQEEIRPVQVDEHGQVVEPAAFEHGASDVVSLSVMANEFNDAMEELGADRSVNEKGYNMLDINAVIAMSVAAIQAQQSMLQEQKQYIENMEDRLRQLEAVR